MVCAFLQEPAGFSGRDHPPAANEDGMQVSSMDQLVNGAAAYAHSLAEVIDAICQWNAAGMRHCRVNCAAKGRWLQQWIAPVLSGHGRTKPDMIAGE